MHTKKLYKWIDTIEFLGFEPPLVMSEPTVPAICSSASDGKCNFLQLLSWCWWRAFGCTHNPTTNKLLIPLCSKLFYIKDVLIGQSSWICICHQKLLCSFLPLSMKTLWGGTVDTVRHLWNVFILNTFQTFEGNTK